MGCLANPGEVVDCYIPKAGRSGGCPQSSYNLAPGVASWPGLVDNIEQEYITMYLVHDDNLAGFVSSYE